MPQFFFWTAIKTVLFAFVFLFSVQGLSQWQTTDGSLRTIERLPNEFKGRFMALMEKTEQSEDFVLRSDLKDELCDLWEQKLTDAVSSVVFLAMQSPKPERFKKRVKAKVSKESYLKLIKILKDLEPYRVKDETMIADFVFERSNRLAKELLQAELDTAMTLWQKKSKTQVAVSGRD